MLDKHGIGSLGSANDKLHFETMQSNLKLIYCFNCTKAHCIYINNWHSVWLSANDLCHLSINLTTLPPLLSYIRKIAVDNCIFE